MEAALDRRDVGSRTRNLALALVDLLMRLGRLAQPPGLRGASGVELLREFADLPTRLLRDVPLLRLRPCGRRLGLGDDLASVMPCSSSCFSAIAASWVTGSVGVRGSERYHSDINAARTGPGTRSRRSPGANRTLTSRRRFVSDDRSPSGHGLAIAPDLAGCRGWRPRCGARGDHRVADDPVDH